MGQRWVWVAPTGLRRQAILWWGGTILTHGPQGWVLCCGICASGPGRWALAEEKGERAWQIYTVQPGSLARLPGPVRISTFQKGGGGEAAEHRASRRHTSPLCQPLIRGRRHGQPRFAEPLTQVLGGCP